MDDGLVTNKEVMATIRDKKGVCFVRGCSGNHQRVMEEKNDLETRVGQNSSSENREKSSFSVDRRLHDAFDAMGYADRNYQNQVFYDNWYNSNTDIYGPFERANVIESYLSQNRRFTFEGLRDLALRIATTESFTGPHNGGGNSWIFVYDAFTRAVTADGLTAE